MKKLLTYEELENFYNSNSDFKDYVDKDCRSGKYTKEECLRHKITNFNALDIKGEFSLDEKYE